MRLCTFAPCFSVKCTGNGGEWIVHKGSCYLLVRRELNYQHASQDCTNRKSYLTEIQSAEENRFVAGMEGSNTKDLWIGYNDRNNEDHWVWTNTGMIGTYTNWYPGEPNNRNDQDCANIWKSKKSTQWDDKDCDESRGQWFVCEKGTEPSYNGRSSRSDYLRVAFAFLYLLERIFLYILLRKTAPLFSGQKEEGRKHLKLEN